MKTLSKLLFITFIAVLILTTMSFSQYKEDAYRLSYLGLGFGARALGLGTAYTGVANDFSAVYWNPAGLGRIRLNEISMGLSHVSYNNTSTLYGSKEDFSNSGTNLNSVGVVYPFPVQQGSLVFAIGYGKQTDFTTALAFKGFNFQNTTIAYPDNVELQARILEGGGLNNWVVGGAVEAVPNLYLGLSLNFISGSYTYNRDYKENDINDQYTLYQYDQRYTVDEEIGGFSARLGLLHEFRNHNGRIGFNIKFPSYLSVKDDYVNDEMEYYDIPDSDRAYYTSGISEFDVKTPFVFSGGISWSFGSLLLSGDIEYTDWTQMEFNNTYADLMAENTVIKDSMESTVNLRFGAEFSIPNTDIQVRAGFAYLPSPYKTDSSPNNQKFITGGLGWIIEDAVKIDLGYAYGFWDTNHGVQFASTSEKITTHNVIGTISYRF